MIAAFSLDADERALREAIAKACSEWPAGAPFDPLHWRALGELGALAAGNDGESGARELVAVCDALGACAHAGPLAETVIALALLEPGGARTGVECGAALASVGAAPHWPFGDGAVAHFAIVAGEVCRAHLIGDAAPLDTLAGDPWIRCEARVDAPAPASGRALALGRIAAAAALAAGGRRLVENAAERARARRQFGRPIGDHQAVSHPLAACLIGLNASEGLARAAAWQLDGEDPAAPELAVAAFESARSSALAAAHQVHQTFGALGVTLEGPVFAISRRIRQWASLPLGGGG